jgi:hypothetical protein
MLIGQYQEKKKLILAMFTYTFQPRKGEKKSAISLNKTSQLPVVLMTFCVTSTAPLWMFIIPTCPAGWGKRDSWGRKWKGTYRTLHVHDQLDETNETQHGYTCPAGWGGQEPWGRKLRWRDDTWDTLHGCTCLAGWGRQEPCGRKYRWRDDIWDRYSA